VFASLFASILSIRRRQHPPAIDPADEAADVVDAAAHRVAAEKPAPGEPVGATARKRAAASSSGDDSD